MDLIQTCAKELKDWLHTTDPKNTAGSTDKKLRSISNYCSALLIASPLLWVIKLLPARAAFIIGGAAFFGSKVVESALSESFLKKAANLLSPKETPSIKIYGSIIFYPW